MPAGQLEPWVDNISPGSLPVCAHCIGTSANKVRNKLCVDKETLLNTFNNQCLDRLVFIWSFLIKAEQC